MRKIFLVGKDPDAMRRSLYAGPRGVGSAAESMARLMRAQQDPYCVEGTLRWCRVPKLRRGRELDQAKIHNVLGAAVDAASAGCHVLAMDCEQAEDAERQHAVDEEVRRAAAALFPALEIIQFATPVP